MDPMTLIMLGLIALLIFFMFRNGRKRRAQAEEMQNNMVPGTEVMLQSGIFATIDSIDDETNRVTVASGDSTFVVHRNAIGQIVTPVDAPADANEAAVLAPDDDPEFGERLNSAEPANDDVVVDDVVVDEVVVDEVVIDDVDPASESSEQKNSEKE